MSTKSERARPKSPLDRRIYKLGERASILCVDDEELERRFLEELLTSRGHEVRLARSGKEAIELFRSEEWDLVILDVIMPEMDGFETCRILRSMRIARYVPVIMVTVCSRLEDKIQGLGLGADDYVTKPFDKAELLARVQAMLRIKSLQDEVYTMSVTDLLTNLNNRRYLQKRLDEEVSRARRYRTPLALIMGDLDHFKEINDRFGHLFGDTVLQRVAGVFRKYVRKEDVVGRWGGEEFLVILPGNHAPGATVLAERLRDEIEGLRITTQGQPVKVTISLGVSGFEQVPKDMAPDAFVKEADVALYRAKDAGRNRIETMTAAAPGGK